jgi:hypothetical protein
MVRSRASIVIFLSSIGVRRWLGLMDGRQYEFEIRLGAESSKAPTGYWRRPTAAALLSAP